MNELEKEYNDPRNGQSSLEYTIYILKFQAKVNDQKISSVEQSFLNVLLLVLILISLPFLNARVERLFPQINVV